MCAGRQPAITALIAMFSTVASAQRGGTTAMTSERAPAGAGDHRLHPLGGRQHERQAIGPAPRVIRLQHLVVAGEGEMSRRSPPPPTAGGAFGVEPPVSARSTCGTASSARR